MLRNANNRIVRPSFPTLASMRQSRAELLDLPPQPLAQPPESNPDPTPRPDPPPQPSFAPPQRPANPALGEAALQGLAGLAVRPIAPHTEAHPAAILLQLLAVFGNLAGRGPRKMQRHSRCASQAPYSSASGPSGRVPQMLP